MSRRSLLSLVFAMATLAAACAEDGRELAEAQDWQTTTTRPPPPTSAPPQEPGSTGVILSSPDFEPGGDAPSGVLCRGDNKFPNLVFGNVPADADELAVALSDQTDPEEPVLLWLMGGIDASRVGLDSGFLPFDAYETLNDYGQPGWGTPCLESFSDGRRDLQFRLYVLDAPAGLLAGAPGNEAWDTVAALAVDSATLLMRVDAAT